ncbi:MAG: YbjP/YqhG family protein [Acidobacteriota bacterium]|nr:YbjP/YqhG family protein [Acidobacteriota bacterium]
MNKKITESILLLTLLISTFSCVSVNRTTEEATNSAANVITTTDSVDSNVEATSANTGGAAQQNTPDALVRDLYKTHSRDSGAILDGKSRKGIDKYFDKTLADFFWKDLTTHRDEVGVLDFDPFYNAQDIEIKNLKVGEPKIEGDRATVIVTFQNFDRKESLTYSLARRSGAWKISDIKYTDGSSLLGYFKDYEKNNPGDNSSSSSSETGNFEGIYKVGETTCTVKPIKMAFEIKWAKGSGTMIFFFDGDASQGRYSYSSENTGKGSDRFVFDDESLTTGTFIRGSDGREMRVSKVK